MHQIARLSAFQNYKKINAFPSCLISVQRKGSTSAVIQFTLHTNTYIYVQMKSERKIVVNLPEKTSRFLAPSCTPNFYRLA